MKLQLFFVSLFLLLSPVIFGQKSSLQIAEIMKGEEFTGYSPQDHSWSMTGNRIYFDWNPNGELARTKHFYDLTTKKILKTTVDNYLLDPEHSNIQLDGKAFFVLDNTLFSYDLQLKKSTMIYSSGEAIQEPMHIPKTKQLYFYSAATLFKYDLTTKSILAVAKFFKGEKFKDQDSTLLMKEEHRLFETHRDEKAMNEWRELNELTFNSTAQIYTGTLSQRNVQISTSERFIVFRLDHIDDQKATEYMNYVTDDGEAKSMKARSKVSGKDPKHEVAIYDLERDTVYLVQFGGLPDIRKKPDYLTTDPSTGALYDSDRLVVPHPLHFALNSDANFMDIRSTDNKDRWIASLDLQTGKLTTYIQQHDEAWIGGPGISSWNMVEGNLGWIADGKAFYYQSEESGYSHLYKYDIAAGKGTQLTSGQWEVHEIKLSKDHKFAYLLTNRSHPGNRDIEKIDLQTGKSQAIFNKSGYHDALLSPNEKQFAIRFSYKNKPWEIYLANNAANATWVQITSSTTTNFSNHSWYDPDVITVANETDEKVYARLYKPNAPNGAAVIFVHGAGYLQNAHNYWSTYYREYMFHNLLREMGFTVLDMDYRASEGYGRDHRTAIYRQMGGADLRDHLFGRNYLIDSLGVDSTRIGIYGGSYGGFITLMALLTEPGKFKCGAALRAVTDWMHYNHEYTSNILNYPETDTEAYRKSSPINYAENLQDRLLILHGMVDDNVQFQDVVRLSQRFIELGKTNWDLAVYPVQAHGFTEANSWHDEYRRILELFTTTLLND